MESYMLSSVMGKSIKGLSQYTTLMGQMASELDYSQLFRPDVTYEAQVLGQQGTRCTLLINGSTYQAESLVNEKLPARVELRFVPSDNDTLSFRLVKNGSLTTASKQAAEIRVPDISQSLRGFMPAISDRQLATFLQALPHLEGDLFENMVSFNYLYRLDEAGVSDKTAQLSRNYTISIDDFNSALQSLAASAGSEAERARPDIQNLLSRLIDVLDRMDRKNTAAHDLQTFTDRESTEFKEIVMTLNSLAAELSGKDPVQRAPSQDGAAMAAQKGIGLPEAKDLHGAMTRQKGMAGSESIVMPERAVADHARAAENKAMPIEQFREFVTEKLNPEKLADSAFKAIENNWQTTFAWNAASGNPSTFLQDFRIEERDHRPGEDMSKEYQLTIDFNLKKTGRVRTILFWMDNTLSCRMICYEPGSYALLSTSRDRLNERLQSSDIHMNYFKIEQAGV